MGIVKGKLWIQWYTYIMYFTRISRGENVWWYPQRNWYECWNIISGEHKNQSSFLSIFTQRKGIQCSLKAFRSEVGNNVGDTAVRHTSWFHWLPSNQRGGKSNQWNKPLWHLHEMKICRAWVPITDSTRLTMEKEKKKKLVTVMFTAVESHGTRVVCRPSFYLPC